MKKIILLSMFLCSYGFAYAQGPGQTINTPYMSCTDVVVTLIAIDDKTNCNVVGISNPISVPASTTVGYDWNSISSSVGWVTDPGDPNMVVWEFGGAYVYNCNATYTSTPGTSGTCGPSNYEDLMFLQIPDCGVDDDCFTYSTNCSSCSSGDEIHGSYTAGSPSMYSVMTLDKL